jgi:hypothetical protein
VLYFLPRCHQNLRHCENSFRKQNDSAKKSNASAKKTDIATNGELERRHYLSFSTLAIPTSVWV